MIKFNRDIESQSQGFNVVQQLKAMLVKIRNTKEIQESDDVF